LITDVATISDKEYNLSGVTITSPKSGKTYVSQDAVTLFIGTKQWCAPTPNLLSGNALVNA
jgi:hypothetical protein